MNWVSTRKMPNITANTTSKVSDPAARPRLANRRISSSGCSWRNSQATKATRATTPIDQTGRRQRRAPALLRAFVDAQHEAADGQRRQQRTERVEATFTVFPRVAHCLQRHDQRHAGEEHGQGEQPWPREAVDEERRDEEAEDATGAGEAGPDPDGSGALLGGEARRDHRERDRHDHRRGDAGQDAGDEEDVDRPGEAGQDVGTGEQHEPAEQDGLAAPAVTDGADGQQQGGEGHGVAVDDPQQLALGRAEVDRQILLGDVQPGHGGDDGDQGRAHGDEDPPLTAGVGDDLVDGVGHGVLQWSEEPVRDGIVSL